MNVSEILRVEGKAGAFKLLYSHDGGFTRYVIEFLPAGYICRLNGVRCFRRGTHDAMARAHGLHLKDMTAAPHNFVDD